MRSTRTWSDLGWFLLAAFAVVLAPASVVAQSVDDPVDAGDVRIVDASGALVSEGQGATTFAVELPSGSSCPGDSLHDQWRVMTFVVPSDVDPARLTYNSIGPEGDGFYALYGLDTNPLVEVLTAANDAPGLPGLILGLPAASFEIFPPGTLPDGQYKVGVACTYFDDTALYWDTEIAVTRDVDDQPAEIRWEVVSHGARLSEGEADGTSTAPALIGVGVVGAVALVWFLSNRSRRRSPVTKEMT
jgi:hypothetical protein